MKKFSELINENEKKVELPSDLKVLAFDWKEFSDNTLKKLKSSLKDFGVNVYTPLDNNSDMYILYLTKSTLDKTQIKSIDDDY